MLVFLGAPYVERLRGNATLSATLTGITASVVGVIASLAVYFALHTLFDRTRFHGWGPVQLELPVLDSLQPAAMAISAVALVMIFGLRWPVLRTLGVCAALGLAAELVS